MGRHPLAEATLAWQRLRPRGGEATEITEAAFRGGTSPSYLPIAYTGDDRVAGRLVRVLAGLTWAVVASRPRDCWVRRPARRLPSRGRVTRSCATCGRSGR
ncbi:hypothetical protein AB0F49_32200 [Micromonospora ureilytica]|uniref:hypothetical protein n=1 Tax=Micromonospora ureilytica TaxID=709868 RepID=UPI0033FAE18C